MLSRFEAGLVRACDRIGDTTTSYRSVAMLILETDAAERHGIRTRGGVAMAHRDHLTFNLTSILGFRLHPFTSLLQCGAIES
ncbi:hypothetical protein A8E25_03685 [Burkholderia cenocepacia]|jgi:hypothetical protein|nr:hypothetical protein WQ49_06205 [Burkholderia cenocepacia]KWF28024.1 hypothetical protein WL84_12115 [Burkholderia cenocepacia]ONR58125.1 hypothetical protein A8E17_17870 [Burkholderia cenocepacia]ONR72159.1 hypothetical protein A8E23_13520 [Burkholderia cenocepacia]ONR79573.1 hypothetical protein A8E18_01975 [Burkholderia cenocepacia]